MDSLGQVQADFAALIEHLRTLEDALPANLHRWQHQGEASAAAQLQFARILRLSAELRDACELLKESDSAGLGAGSARPGGPKP